MGIIFSDGNLKNTLARFTNEHVCTTFCQYFGLKPFTELEDGEVIL